MPAFDIPNVGRMAMVADPQGAPFYIMKPTPPANDPNAKSDVFSPTEQQRVALERARTSIPPRRVDFYTGQFGWDDGEFMDMGEMGEYRFLDHGGDAHRRLCGVMPGGQSQVALLFPGAVDRRPRKRDCRSKAGGTIHMGPHKVPTATSSSSAPIRRARSSRSSAAQ